MNRRIQRKLSKIVNYPLHGTRTYHPWQRGDHPEEVRESIRHFRVCLLAMRRHPNPETRRSAEFSVLAHLEYGIKPGTWDQRYSSPRKCRLALEARYAL